MPRYSPSLPFTLSLLAAGLLGFGLVMYSTAWGAGWMSDSFQYVSAAVNLAQGKGFVYNLGGGAPIPMTHYPPLYSALLSPFALLGLDVIEVARMLNAVLMGANACLVGLSLKIITRSAGFAMLGALLAALSPAMIETHAWVLSEPLFLFLSLLSLLCLARYLEGIRWAPTNQDSVSPLFGKSAPRVISSGALIAGALLAGSAWLTRYAGVSLVVAGGLGLLFLLQHNRKEPWLKRIQVIALWLALSLAPMLFWTLRTTLTGGFDDRSLAINWMTPKNIGVFLNTLLTWWLPPQLINGREKLILAVLAIVLLLLLAWLIIRRVSPTRWATGVFRKYRPSFHPLLLMHAVFFITYALMILALKNILEEGMGLGDRMLIPLYPSGVVLVIALLSTAWQGRKAAVRVAVATACLYLLLYNGMSASAHVQDFHKTGFGVSKRAWHESAAVQTMTASVGLPIYSNSPQSVYRWRQDAGFPLSSFKNKARRGDTGEALVVIFKYISEEGQYAGLVKDLELLVQDNIASVYLYRQ